MICNEVCSNIERRRSLTWTGCRARSVTALSTKFKSWKHFDAKNWVLDEKFAASEDKTVVR